MVRFPTCPANHRGLNFLALVGTGRGDKSAIGANCCGVGGCFVRQNVGWFLLFDFPNHRCVVTRSCGHEPTAFAFHCISALAREHLGGG